MDGDGSVCCRNYKGLAQLVRFSYCLWLCIQGIDEYVETEHLVRFEIDFDKNARLAKDWQIIDVDDFLGGNPYLPQLGDGSSTEEGAARGEGGEGRGRRKDE